ncbi:MAG: hypothetical protein HQM13_00785 [SAR324 cluster bacterium]|nr:hypothetical protein [SAR324 cluster bacterium]
MENGTSVRGDDQEISNVLKPYGYSWSSFLKVQELLKKSSHWHYTRHETGKLHQALQSFRSVGGLELFQRSLKSKLLGEEMSREEQGYETIDAAKGDRVYLNELLLKYARQSDESLYVRLVEPQLNATKKSKKKRPFSFSIPLETDSIILIGKPLSCFEMLVEVKEYQQGIQDKTRWLYVEDFMNRWFFKFNRFALASQKNLAPSLYRIFFRAPDSVEGFKNLHLFVAQITAEHFGDQSPPFAKESRNNLRTIYLILLNLLLLLLQKKQMLPADVLKIFTELNHLKIFSRKHYLVDGMRADYEKFHLLPNLSRKVSSSQQQAALQNLSKKRFINFWEQFRKLPSYQEKVYLCSNFAEADQLFLLEQLVHFKQILELAKLHEHTEKVLNHPEEIPGDLRRQIGAQGSKFLRNLWQIVEKYNLAEDQSFTNKAEVIQYVRTRFGAQNTEVLAEDEFSISEDERKKGRKKDWRQLTIHEVPPYTKVKKWSQIARLPYDVPRTEEILFSFMPYVRINTNRLEDRLTIAHCIEFCRLPFRYLAASVETRFKFHFITIGDLLLMKVLGATEHSSHSLFRFLHNSKQISEAKMVDLLIKVYPVIEIHFGEILRKEIPFVINHRYAYKGGGLNGINAGIAIERINEMEDKSSIFLSAGKMFYRCAEEILMHTLFQLEPQFIEEGLTVEKKMLDAYFAKKQFEDLLEICLEKSSVDFSPFRKWWKKLSSPEKVVRSEQIKEEISLQHQMFFHEYPNPYVLPTS